MNPYRLPLIWLSEEWERQLEERVRELHGTKELTRYAEVMLRYKLQEWTEDRIAMKEVMHHAPD